MAILTVKTAKIIGDPGTPTLQIRFDGTDDDGNKIPVANVSVDVGKWMILRSPGGRVWLGEEFAEIFPDDVPPILYDGDEIRGVTNHKVVVACAQAFMEWMDTLAGQGAPGVIYEKDSGFKEPFTSYNSRL